MNEPLISQVQALIQESVAKLESKVEDQQKMITDQQKMITDQQKMITDQQKMITELRKKSEDQQKMITELRKKSEEFTVYTDESRAWMRHAKRVHNSLVYSINDRELQNEIKENVKDVKGLPRKVPLYESNKGLNDAINRLSSTRKGDIRNKVCHTFHNDDDRNKNIAFRVTEGLFKENILPRDEASSLYDKTVQSILDPTLQKLEVFESPPKAPLKERPTVVASYTSPAGKRGKNFVSSPRGIVPRGY